MNNEIDLREIFGVLWRGKYLIIGLTAFLTLAAVLYLFFGATPLYQYSALLDLSTYEVKGKDVFALIEQNELIKESLTGLVDHPGELARSAEVNTLDNNDSVLRIKTKYADPKICRNAVERIGVTILETLSENRYDQMVLEKKRSEKLLGYLDETVAEYLQSRDKEITGLLEEDPIYKRLLEEKAACLLKLKLLNFNIGELTDSPTLDAETWISGQDETAKLVPVNKKFYLAAAILFGLLLSIFVLFIHHYFTKVIGRVEKD